MSALTPSAIARAVKGSWLRTPADEALLAGASIDSREAQTNKLFVAIKGATHDGHDFAASAANDGARLLIVERPIDLDRIARSVPVLRVESSRAALMQLAAWYRSTFAHTTVVAVTGSAGKTTTRQMIYSVLCQERPGLASPRSFNNDIGLPLTLLAVQDEHAFVVAEVGINAVGEMQPLADIVRPDMVVVTNVGDSHLEGLHDVATVASEKLRLCSTLQPGGVAILHADSPALVDAAAQLPAPATIIWFGDDARADIRRADAAAFTLALPGRHNVTNALAAIAVARRLNVSEQAITRGLAHVIGLPMRMEMRALGSARVMNDAYNANPQSMLASVETFLELTGDAPRRVLMLGDMKELGEAGPGLHEHVGRQIAHMLQDVGPCLLVCFGAMAGEFLARGVRQHNDSIEIITLGDIRRSTGASLIPLLREGDALLLKASRSMGLEKLMTSLELFYGQDGLEMSKTVKRPTPSPAHP